MKLIASALVGALLFGAAPSWAQTIDLEALGWPARCQQMREILVTQAGADTVYADAPSALPMIDVWRLEAGGFAVPVLARSYNDVIVSRAEDGALTVILAGTDQHAIIVSSMAIVPMDDVFAISNWHGGVEGAPDGTAWTHELFDGPADLGVLTELGYRSQPSDLTCDTANWRIEIPIALALSLKSLGPGELAGVYRLTGEFPGWLTQRVVDGDQMVWEASRAEPSRIWFANLSGPMGSLTQDLGFLIDHPDLTATSEPPVWLDALGAALEADEPAAWQAFADVLVTEGISQRSIEAARALGVVQTP